MVRIDEHLRAVHARKQIDTGLYSPLRGVQTTINPLLQKWGGRYVVDIKLSGSFAKGTAVHGGTDIDIFVSPSSTLTDSLKDIYDTLFNALAQAGYDPRRQNVSVGIAVIGRPPVQIPLRLRWRLVAAGRLSGDVSAGDSSKKGVRFRKVPRRSSVFL
jgi:Nucleotidyltransferase domain